MRRTMTMLAGVALALLLTLPGRAEPEEITDLGIPLDQLVGRFNNAAVDHRMPLRLSFERCEKFGLGRMCYYRLSATLTVVAFAMNQPDQVNVLTVFADVGDRASGAITQWVNAMAVASYVFSPSATGPERVSTIKRLAAIVEAPRQPVTAMLHDVKYEAFVALQLTGRVKRPK